MPADVLVEQGALFTWQGETLVIERVNQDYSVLARRVDGGDVQRVPVAELGPPPNATEGELQSLVLTEIDAWAEARRRLSLIKPILEKRVPKAELSEILAIAGVDKATLYRWARKYQAVRRLSALVPFRQNGGRGKNRLPSEDEELIQEVIQTFHLTQQQPTNEATIEEVRRRFRFAGRKPPAPNTILLRLSRVTERERLRRTAHAKESRTKFDAHPGHYDEAIAPLSVVQMDHTRLDILLVDERDHLEIGRPNITLAIDVFSRMIVGYYISLDPVGDIAAGQCIANMMLTKEVLLGQLGIAQSWPCWGAPATLHLDNAGEFHSEMMMRACQQYSINLEFRPLLKPNYGGHIERLMGTVANEIRRLPGATFSNPRQRGEYDSKKHSGITLPVLEKILVNWITGAYHHRLHRTLKMPPIKKWELGVFGDGENPGSGLRPRPTDALQIHLDLLPHKTGTVQTYGIQLDNVRYFSDALRPYIGSGRKFNFKRDPRNISELYFIDPETGRYTAIPYRDTRLPTLSVWELRAINAELRKQGRLDVDESAIREVYEQNAAEVARAVTETRKARRDRARREHRKPLPPIVRQVTEADPEPTRQAGAPLAAFEIEDL